jgi:ribonuclease BN (tRNA processing enzyme)
MKITFLGSGDAFGGGGRLQACIHLDDGREPLLVDCGATALIALKRAAIDPASIGWVALSHLHGDHFAGLPWLILDGQFAKRTRPLVVAGPRGARDRTQAAFEALYPGAWDTERAFATSFRDLDEGVVCQIGPARITCTEVRHGSGAPAYALRIAYADKVIAYSGDTEWTDSLLDVAAGADLFICECNFFDTQAPGHLDHRTLAAKRADLACKRIVITHMSAEMLEHLGEAEFETAFDGLVIEL